MKFYAAFRKCTDTVVITESLSRFAKKYRVLPEITLITDTCIKVKNISWALSETTPILDSLSKRAFKFHYLVETTTIQGQYVQTLERFVI